MNSKMKMSKTRVTSGGEKPTPIKGSPQHIDPIKQMKGRMPKRKSEMPRKNDPQKGNIKSKFKIGTRVTSSETRKR